MFLKTPTHCASPSVINRGVRNVALQDIASSMWRQYANEEMMLPIHIALNATWHYIIMQAERNAAQSHGF
jgi:hypothetical protein